ncbi:hypothetical protein [Spongiivirga citrea]|uniref:Uncharacterized protein n=1 Tax=Spongiivirga citrea TaxID=1481457 RepID=A0A6M0CDD8_9FLAO|nr:hypothetical protein [Spongiivirga citrea]NER15741.1 hypothetical protein [Spongiivirga citrea]
MSLVIILVLLLLLIIVLLLVPVIVYINTDTNQYYIKLQGLAKASIQEDSKELILVKVQLPFYHFYFYPLTKKNGRKKKKAQKKKSSWNKNLKKVIRLITSFRVTKLSLDLDTGDSITNAKLYPAFALFNFYRSGVRINFEGRNKLILELKNRPIYMVKSLINI